MKIKLILTTIIIIFLMVGCSKIITAKSTQINGKSGLTSSLTNSAIDYKQYIKKSWIEKNGTNNLSFCIYKIEDGKITGEFTADGPAVLTKYNLEDFSGTIINDTAECEFSDKAGNKGNIEMVFKPNDEMEATIKFKDNSHYFEQQPKDGTFQFIPYNLNKIEGFNPIKNQSFTVNLNSWGSVNFVSGKLTGGDHTPTVFYLTNKNGDIIFDFDAELPYNVDVKAVSFVDVNKDGLKDIIIIVATNDDNSQVTTLATVYLQNVDGSFTNDPNLDQEINDSGNNQNINSVINYISKKF